MGNKTPGDPLPGIAIAISSIANIPTPPTEVLVKPTMSAAKPMVKYCMSVKSKESLFTKVIKGLNIILRGFTYKLN